jgi:hypothetical protein
MPLLLNVEALDMIDDVSRVCGMCARALCPVFSDKKKLCIAVLAALI